MSPFRRFERYHAAELAGANDHWPLLAFDFEVGDDRGSLEIEIEQVVRLDLIVPGQLSRIVIER